MSSTLDSTRAFAQLVWLLVHRTASTNEQKQSLRDALGALRDDGSVVSLAELHRSIASASQLVPVPAELPWLSELASRMAGHSVGLLDFSPNTRAADVLGVARILASTPVHGDEGGNFDARAKELQLTTVAIRLGRAGFVRRGTPIATTRMSAIPMARTPAMGVMAVDGSHLTAPARAMGIGAPTPSSGIERIPAPADAPPGESDEGRMIEAAFSRQGQMRGTEDVLRRLARPLMPGTAPQILDDLSRLAEEFARDGLWEGVAELMQRVVAREDEVTDADVKRAFLIHIRRLCKPGIFRGLAQLLVKRRDLREGLAPVFVRAGDVGAEALIDLMVSANLAAERRVYRSMIARCPAAAEPLTHLLHDGRWYVVRNAADLLGEMGVRESDAELMGALKHSDARVRRAAVGALARLGTARGVHAIQHLLGDANAAVRLQAVHGLASARLPRSVPSLLQALAREGDPELQQAILHALGAHPTEESVEALSQAAQPGTLLNRKAPAYRLAAVHALGDAATPSALAALRRLQSDKDRELRAAVERALAAHAQGNVASLAGR